MERSWMEKRKEIYRLIKKISDHYGGDDGQWLKEYAKGMVEKNKENLDVALECFRDLEKQINRETIS